MEEDELEAARVEATAKRRDGRKKSVVVDNSNRPLIT
jgi:hypothetical protein